MEAISRAITEAVRAGRYRAYVRENGEQGLAGLLKLAERHSALAGAELDRVADDGLEKNAAGPHTPAGGARLGVGE